MKPEKHERTVTLLCPTCGGTEFKLESDAPESTVTCTRCERTLTRDELIRENSENIELHLEDVRAGIIKDVAKELQNSLRKALRNNKYIKFKRS